MSRDLLLELGVGAVLGLLGGVLLAAWFGVIG